jgi:hypothetical protein
MKRIENRAIRRGRVRVFRPVGQAMPRNRLIAKHNTTKAPTVTNRNCATAGMRRVAICRDEYALN